MSFPESPRNAAQLQPPPHIMNVEELERINSAAATAASGNNPAVPATGNKFLLAAVSSTINLPGF